MSNLYVFGRAQDLASEKPTNDVQNRGHIRLWETSMRPGGQPVWVGQASYDHGIELSGTNGLPTHHIAPAVDLERDAVGTDLEHTGLVVTETYGAFTSPIFVAHNGGGDYYESDGDALVITVTSVSLPLTTSSGLTGAVTDLKHSVFHFYDALLTTLPIALAVGLIGLAVLVVAVWPGLRRLWQQASTRGGKDEARH